MVGVPLACLLARLAGRSFVSTSPAASLSLLWPHLGPVLLFPCGGVGVLGSLLQSLLLVFTLVLFGRALGGVGEGLS